MSFLPSLRGLCALVTVTALVAAQSPDDPSWPGLDAERTKHARQLIDTMAEGSEDEASTAESDLVDMGAGVAPVALTRLRNVRPASLAGGLVRVLDAVVAEEHAPLVRDLAKDRDHRVRAWSVGWLARHADEAHAETFEKALEDDDPDVVFAGAVGLVALGRLEHLEAVLEGASEDWSARGALAGKALPRARSAEAGEAVFEHMPDGDAAAQISGLRLLRSLATKEQAPRIARYLDGNQHAIKKEAINALRVVVDGDPPLEELSVFQVIDAAKKWQERIR